ncbi:hypothetical protein [Desertivirga arenae]|uniref:hypothetical protein n=1 Tax=Desertivirga arenae TaxID=2810309 RepID=UPI001A96F796|nr:hypothetical protein [Pedobacter sp. SYSU D00823]
MKVLAIFMTILMLITGVDLCNNLDKNESKASTEMGKSNEKHSDEAPCSPFCHCARCPFSVVLPSVLIELSVSIIKGEKFSEYSSMQPVHFASSVWQPPKAV